MQIRYFEEDKYIEMTHTERQEVENCSFCINFGSANFLFCNQDFLQVFFLLSHCSESFTFVILSVLLQKILFIIFELLSVDKFSFAKTSCHAFVG